LHDEKFDKIFEAIEEKTTPQRHHIFYDGQIKIIMNDEFLILNGNAA
jgi:hypothetical protein